MVFFVFQSEDVIFEQNSDTDVESDEDDHIERLKAKRVELHRRKEERLRDKESMNVIFITFFFITNLMPLEYMRVPLSSG